VSENIRVLSIVGRYLEHSRAYWFGNGGSPELYLSSADLMGRNLDRRVELMFPVLQEDCRSRVLEVLEAQFADNQKARLLLPDGAYRAITPGKAEPSRAQEALYQKLRAEHDRILSTPPSRFVPLERQ